MACRFAKANDLSSYWDMTRSGRDGFGPVPHDRWDHSAFLNENRRKADHSYAPRGAFVDDVRSFPALHFGMPPRRVQVTDPQQRLALELAYAAIEDMGTAPNLLPRRTGVFMGVSATEYRSFLTARIQAKNMATGFFGQVPDDPNSLAQAMSHTQPARPFSAAGGLGNMVAAAVAQELDLHGPAYSIDAACASSLLALSDAATYLRAGTVDVALAGGVYLCVTPDNFVAFSRLGAMSEAGACRPFDHRADGFVQGDGGGVVVLKRLEDAVADNDRIYAVLHGISTNNDGRGDGPMAPVEDGQVEVIEDAWNEAGLDRSLLGYMESHGTGTKVGDKTEFQGLVRVFGDHASQVAVGSAKANVGHTMSAAGIAGVIRAALSIHHKTLPPMAGFEVAKEELHHEETPFHFPTESSEWTMPRRVAGVSSFGFGGTNGHCVLADHMSAPSEESATCELLLLSSGDEDALRATAARMAEVLDHAQDTSLRAIARTLAGRPTLEWRLACTASSTAEFVEQLRAVAGGDLPNGCAIGSCEEETPKVAFLFPGQGAQRLGMLSDARERFPVIAQTLDALEAQGDGVLTTRLQDLLYPQRRELAISEEQARQDLTHTAHCQPALFACHEALRALLEQVGVTPHVCAGHSLGEFNAAVASGILTPDAAYRFVAKRGRAMAGIEGDPGAMAAIMADRDATSALLEDGCVIANFNHPKQHVVSGHTAAVERVVARAEAAGVPAKQLEVSHGFHSPCFEGLDVDALVSELDIHAASVPLASAISGALHNAPNTSRDIFLRHANSPVNFVDALKACEAQGADLYLQVGAGGPLASFARKIVGSSAKAVLTLGSRDDNDGGRSILSTLGWLYVFGVPLDLHGLLGSGEVVTVPPTILPRQEYWAIGSKPARGLDVGQGVQPGIAARLEAETVPTAQVVPNPEDAGSERTTLSEVIALVARVSSYPKAAIKPGSTLIDDLGFDSIMVGDLATAMTEAFAGVDGLPQELLINRPTVQDLVDHVDQSQGEGNAAQDDNAPLLDYTATRVRAPLPTETRDTSTSSPTRGHGPGLAQLDGVTTLLQAPTGSQPGLLLWVAALQENTEPLHTTSAFLATVARQTAPSDVLVIRREDDIQGEGLAGAVRSLAREWPQQRVRCLTFASHITDDDVLRLAHQEIGNTDESVEVLYRDDGRFVPGFTAEETRAVPDDLSAERIAITGGTRGIGLALAKALVSRGAHTLLIGRSAPSSDVSEWAQSTAGKVTLCAANVCDLDAMRVALSDQRVTGLFHAAGLLADGAVESVTAESGDLARQVKAVGLQNAWTACGETLQWSVAIGSWAARFGNRHQTHYASANGLMAGLALRPSGTFRSCVAEFGPWTESDMAQTIPAAVRASLRAEGVDFTANGPGLDALMRDIGRDGCVVHGRRVPSALQRCTSHHTVALESHPYLEDHAIDGVPVVPMVVALDWIADAAHLTPPYQVRDLTLYRGITVSQPTHVEVRIRDGRAEVLVGEDKALAYKATVQHGASSEESLPPVSGDTAPTQTLNHFYSDVTFHGPMLAGLKDIQHIEEDNARGLVQTGTPSAWIPSTTRAAWTADPLALDSALQLAAFMAWTQFGRAGTPVAVGRYTQHSAMPNGLVEVTCRLRERSGDRFSADFTLRAEDGTLVATMENASAELQDLAQSSEDDTPSFDAQWVDPSAWPEIVDLELRLEGALALGIENPYFAVHEGTAKNTTVIDGREHINFSSYNYLGLSGDPRVIHTAQEATQRFGTSVSASRVASGERPFHVALERELAAAQGVEDALVFTAGHATNVTTIGHLMGPKDLILHDEFIHDSALQGIKLSGAGRRGFRHEDPEHLERLLKEMRGHHEKVLIIVEGVYSMDGDITRLPEFLELKKRYGCLLMVDEAHSFGVVGTTGCGVAEHFGIDAKEVDLWMGTLSKSLASCGGWIGGSKTLINFLRYTAPGFVYSAGITPANAVAGLTSLRLMLKEPERVQTLQSNASYFHKELVKRGVDTGPALGGSAVIPAITGNSMHALILSQRLKEQGINVQPIVYPAVADDASRLRFFLSSTHTIENLRQTAEAVANTLAGIREEYPLP
jgi:8-amino-7-oxononanoate synthase